jgi:hypothetical protein
VHSVVLLGQPPAQRDEFGQGQFGHAAGAGERGVEYRDAPLGRRFQVDPAGLHAEYAHREQAGRLFRGGVRGGGHKLDAENVRSPQPGRKLVFVRRAVQRFHRVAVLVEPRRGARVNSVEQQHADVFREYPETGETGAVTNIR